MPGITVPVMVVVIGIPWSKPGRIPHPVSVVIFGVPFVKIAVMANPVFDDHDLGNYDFARVFRDDFDRSSVFNRAAFNGAGVIRTGNNAARGETSDG